LVIAILISLLDRTPSVYTANEAHEANIEKPDRMVWISWIALAIVMLALYIFFNGH
jgi:SSS family solute:Na+ symporter